MNHDMIKALKIEIWLCRILMIGSFIIAMLTLIFYKVYNPILLLTYIIGLIGFIYYKNKLEKLLNK